MLRELRTFQMIRDAYRNGCIKNFWVELSDGTFNRKEYISSLKKSSGKLMDNIDFLTQMPYISILIWIPLVSMLLALVLVIDVFIVFYFTYCLIVALFK